MCTLLLAATISLSALPPAEYDDTEVVTNAALRRMARFLNRKSQRYYRLKFADTYYGELNHYGMHWLRWADVRRRRY